MACGTGWTCRLVWSSSKSLEVIGSCATNISSCYTKPANAFTSRRINKSTAFQTTASCGYWNFPGTLGAKITLSKVKSLLSSKLTWTEQVLGNLITQNKPWERFTKFLQGLIIACLPNSKDTYKAWITWRLQFTKSLVKGNLKFALGFAMACSLSSKLFITKPIFQQCKQSAINFSVSCRSTCLKYLTKCKRLNSLMQN